MRALNELIVALLMIACMSGCSGRAGVAPAAGGDATAADSLDSDGMAGRELLFEEQHAHLLAELGARERPGKIDARLEEARSIIEAAEEFYLEGETQLAVELLTKAEVLLRTNP